MSNFMHKVKDTARGFKAPNNFDDTRDTHRPANPHIMDPGRDQYNTSGMGQSPGMGSNAYGSGPGSGNEMGTYHDSELDDTKNTGVSVNAGPHDSKLANKMDPRVDSNLDTRGKYAGTTGSQNISAGAQHSIPNNTASIEQPSYGSDNHINSENNYSSSMQEQNSHSQPGDDRVSSEDKHSSSTQEHKSHSATSHITPCQMDSNVKPGLDSRMCQQNLGGSATGGSSYNDNRSGIREPAGLQPPGYVNKLDPRVHDSNYQQNDVSNQRGGY